MIEYIQAFQSTHGIPQFPRLSEEANLLLNALLFQIVPADIGA